MAFLGRFSCTDELGRPHRLIGDAGAGAGEGGDEELCRIMVRRTGEPAAFDMAGGHLRLQKNGDGSYTVLRQRSGDEGDPDQILLEQPAGAGGELPEAEADRLRRAVAPQTGDRHAFDVAKLRGISAINRDFYRRK